MFITMAVIDIAANLARIYAVEEFAVDFCSCFGLSEPWNVNKTTPDQSIKSFLIW